MPSALADVVWLLKLDLLYGRSANPRLHRARSFYPRTMHAPNIPQIRLYQDWLRDQRALRFESYGALWQWSVTDLEAFWQSLWDYEEMDSPTLHSTALADDRMPGAVWFPGAQVNYARRVLRHVNAAHAAGMPAIVSDDELSQVREMSWPELQRQVASLAIK